MLKIRHSLDTKRVNPQTVDSLPLQKPLLTISSPMTIPLHDPPPTALLPTLPLQNLPLTYYSSPTILPTVSWARILSLAPSKTHP